MMRNTVILIFCLLTWSCSHNYFERDLLVADSLMECCPDSSLNILNHIDTVRLNDAQRNKLFVLLAQANYKNYNDSLAYDYLKKTVKDIENLDNANDRMRGLFYLAQLKFGIDGNYFDAMTYILRASKIAKSIKDSLWIARCYELQSDISSYTKNAKDALVLSQKAQSMYEQIGLERNALFCRCDVGKSLSEGGKPYEGILILDSIIRQASQEPIDYMLLTHAYEVSVPIRLKIKQYKEAYQELAFLNNVFPEQTYHLLVYNTLVAMNLDKPNLDSLINHLIEKSKTIEQKRYTYYLLCQYRIRQGNIDQAGAMLDSLQSIDMTSYSNDVEQLSIKAERDYNYEGMLYETRKALRKERIIILLSVLSFIVISLLVIRYYYTKLRIKRRIERLKSEIYTLSLETKLAKNNYNNENKAFLRQGWLILEKICDASPNLIRRDTNPAEYPNNSKAEQRTNKILIDALNDLCTKKSMMDLSKRLDDTFDGIATKLKNTVRISESDFAVACLIMAQCPMSLISVILDKNVKTLYTKRSRLVNELKKIDNDDANQIISMLELNK